VTAVTDGRQPRAFNSYARADGARRDDQVIPLDLFVPPKRGDRGARVACWWRAA
jgi:hypothetical protein